MPASWLTNALGPNPAPRVVSVQRNAPPSFQGGYGTSGTGTNPFGNLDIPTLLKKLQEQNDAANNAGLDQYKNLMASVTGTSNRVIGPGGLYDQAGTLMGNMGNAGRQRIQSNMVQQQAGASQDLVSRGLNNTTIGASMNRGIASDAERAQQSLDEQVAGAKAGLLTQRAGAEGDMGRLTADSILSRRNVPPDAAMYAQLIAQLARSGGTGSFPQASGSYGAAGPGGGRGGTRGENPEPMSQSTGDGGGGTKGENPGPMPQSTGGNGSTQGGVTTVTGEKGGGAFDQDMSKPSFWISVGYAKGAEANDMALRHGWNGRNG
jgi:hypothetical protein